MLLSPYCTWIPIQRWKMFPFCIYSMNLIKYLIKFPILIQKSLQQIQYEIPIIKYQNKSNIKAVWNTRATISICLMVWYITHSEVFDRCISPAIFHNNQILWKYKLRCKDGYIKWCWKKQFLPEYKLTDFCN